MAVTTEMSKNKRPRLLFNNSPYCLPLNAATTYWMNVNTHYIKPGITSAAVARPYFKGHKQASKNKPAVPLWWVLLDSGSNGDFLFRKKGKKTHNIL